MNPKTLVISILSLIATNMAHSISTESQCGQTLDFQEVEQYDGSEGPSPSFVMQHQGPVGRLETSSSSALCTGTLISNNLFLTAGHCFDPGGSQGAQVRFDYQSDANGNNKPGVVYTIAEIVEYRLGGHDYAIVRLTGDPGSVYGFSEIDNEIPYINEILTIIQHPNGIRKVIEAGPYAGIATSGSLIGYAMYEDLDTAGGSSGSGVLNSVGKIIAVHTNAGCTQSGGANHGVLIDTLLNSSPVIQRILGTTSFAHVSSRGYVGPQPQHLNIGFTISGTASKRIHFMGVGPVMDPLISEPVLQNPTITVKVAGVGTLLGANDNFGTLSSSIKTELSNAGHLPTYANESALALTLAPGTYIVRLDGVSGTSGIAQIRLFDQNVDNGSNIIHVSSRAHIRDNPAERNWLGFVPASNNTNSIVAISRGPSVALPASLTLDNPKIVIKKSGATVAQNDDWRAFDGSSTWFESFLTAFAIAPTNNLDSGLLYITTPGSAQNVIVEGSTGNKEGITVTALY